MRLPQIACEIIEVGCLPEYDKEEAYDHLRKHKNHS